MRRRMVAAAAAAVMFLLAAAGSAATASAAPALDVAAFRLPPQYGFVASHGAFLHLDPGHDHAQMLRSVRATGAQVGIDARAADAVWVTADAAALARAAALPDVTGLDPVREVELASETSVWATGVRQTHEPTGGADLRLRDAQGNVIDGSGVGIAVIDTGIDATHPDLRWAGLGDADPKVIRNFHLVGGVGYDASGNASPPHQYAEASHTDTMGHGTHVAGIAAGSGAASGGRFRGVAPGAKIYGFAPGRVYPFLSTDVIAALQWIYDHGHAQDPPIRVINGSFGSAGPHNPDRVESRLVEALVRDRGVTLVRSAGNAGGDGTADHTNYAGKTPTPGVLMVANYTDEQKASTTGRLDDSSSRGLASDPLTWPDISAPGTSITAPCSAGEWMCVLGVRSHQYAAASGTSMAAPHIAGVVALLYQAKTDLTPAEVEHLLESTARKITFGAPYEDDPLHPGATSSFDKGHGLVDAYAAVAALVGGPSGEDAGRATTLATDGDDALLVGAHDMRSLTIDDAADGTITLRLGVRDLQDGATPRYRVEFVTPGQFVRLTYDVRGETVVTGGAPALAAGVEGDEVVATYDAAALGLSPGSIIVDAAAVSLTPFGSAADGAPSGRETLSATHQGSEEHVLLGAAATATP